MRIASWNVNSIRTRTQRVVGWLEAYAPDVLCLQEVKVVEKDFPFEAIEQVGYRAVMWGQKTYNGVALISREPLADLERGIDGGGDDEQRRVIAGTLGDVRVVSVYVPNGKTVGSEKWEYKLAWLDRFAAWVEEQRGRASSLLLCGDFNIARDARDVNDEAVWEGTVLYNDEMRARFQGFLDAGFVDTFRVHHDEGDRFSWWDYRGLAFPRNEGCRIDYVLAAGPLAERCTAAFIDREQRKKGACPEEKASDHVPVVADFD